MPTERTTRMRRDAKKPKLSCNDDNMANLNLLSILPDDVLLMVLLFFDSNEHGPIKRTCKTLCRQVCFSEPLWRDLCLRTGKIFADDKQVLSSDGFQILYYQSPCVPVDVPNIAAALGKIRDPSRPFTVTLMPGIYNERIEMNVCSRNLPYIPENERYQSDTFGALTFTKDQTVTICIRAAFPDQNTVLLHNGEGSDVDEPCVNIYSSGPDLACHGLFHLELQNISLVHYTMGNDIWGGNTCARVDGTNTLLMMKSCTIQSDSGRGIGKNIFEHISDNFPVRAMNL